jgi:hypothetical protein
MNIIQLEDNLKSLPDNNLQNEMINPTGMFPQYLVMSEIQRREEMRNDYQGRMAANEKTPPRPSMREEMMMGITQPQPMMQDSGIAGLLPAQPQGAPIPPTMSAGPDVIPMYGGGIVGMSAGRNVFGLTDEELKLAGLYDDPTTPEDESQTEYEKAILDYYNTLQTEQPERIAKERSFNQGINLMKAGLALGTAGTFKDLSKGLEKTIDSIDASNKAISKKEDDLKKAALEKAKATASADAMKQKRLTDLAKMKTDRESKEALADYYKAMDPKTKLSPVGQIAKEIQDGLYGPPETLDIFVTTGEIDEKGNQVLVRDEKGKPIPDGNKLINLASSKVSTIASADIRTTGSKQEELVSQLNEAMGSFSTVQEISELVKDGLSREQAYDRVRARKEIEIRQQLGLPTIQQNYSGGVVGQSVQDFNDVVKTINA